MITAFKKKISKAADGLKGTIGRRRLKPDFLIIGAQKGGTSAIFDYLSRHPVIKAPEVKEIDFFCSPTRFGKGEEFYHSHFPTGNAARLSTFEASPAYLMSSKAPGRIRDYRDDMKLVVVFRDPVERAYSAWNMYKTLYKVDNDWFHKWMKRCDERFRPQMLRARDREKFSSFHHAVTEGLAMIKAGGFFDFEAVDGIMEAPIVPVGHYAEHLERYLKRFDRDQILVLDYADLKSDAKAVLTEIENFVGLPPLDWEKQDLKPVFKGEYENTMPDKTRDLLREYYRPLNERFFKLVGRSFDWQ